MQQIADNLWTFDGPDVRFMTLDFPTRMTIARIDESLWVHSPIPITPEISEFIASHGAVTDVIAPNGFHHLYLDGWLEEFPEASFYAAPGLRKKRPDFQFSDDLAVGKEYPWSAQIDHEHFVGNPYVEEVVFFHRQSRTLILTDLVLNLKLDGFSWWQKTFAKFDNVAFPNGKCPRTMRLTMRDRKAALICYERMVGWAPQRIIISHGECFMENGADEVKRCFGWIAA